MALIRNMQPVLMRDCRRSKDKERAYITDESPQKVYITFEKGQTPTPTPPLFLAQLSLLFIWKKERILPCLIASCIGVYFRADIKKKHIKYNIVENVYD